jgi:glycosyltransferase 2 family protein
MARSWIGAAVALAVLVLAGVLLARTVGRYDLADVRDALQQLEPRHIVGAAMCSIGSYVVLTGVDLLGIRYAGRELPYRHIALASFVALSLGHSLGFAALSSGAVRFRFYRRWGLKVFEVARVILFCGLTVLLGYATVGGIMLATSAGWVSETAGIPEPTLRLVSAVALAIPVLYLVAVALGRPVRIGRIEIVPPRPGLAAAQLLVGILDVLLVAGVLHQTLGGSEAISFSTLLTVYVAAAVAGMLAQAPGGIGVVEAVTLAALPGAETIAGLLAFRAIYYLVPLVLGGVALAIFEICAGRRAPVG